MWSCQEVSDTICNQIFSNDMNKGMAKNNTFILNKVYRGATLTSTPIPAKIHKSKVVSVSIPLNLSSSNAATEEVDSTQPSLLLKLPKRPSYTSLVWSTRMKMMFAIAGNREFPVAPRNLFTAHSAVRSLLV